MHCRVSVRTQLSLFNRNEIWLQREPKTHTVGTSVHVILISLNPISTNPVLNALSETISPTHTDAGDLGGVREGERLLVSQNGRHYYHCIQTAYDHSIQPGEQEHGPCVMLSVMVKELLNQLLNCIFFFFFSRTKTSSSSF